MIQKTYTLSVKLWESLQQTDEQTEAAHAQITKDASSDSDSDEDENADSSDDDNSVAVALFPI